MSEVDKDRSNVIYDQLHKKYIYENGRFFLKSTGRELHGALLRNSHKIGFQITFRVDGKKFDISYHHCVWIYHKGYKAKYLHHIDGNPTNNSIENLIECTRDVLQFENNGSKTNKTGFKGVCKYDNKFYGKVCHLGKTHLTKSMSTPEEAHVSYLELKDRLRGEFVPFVKEEYL